ncbi:MAG: MucB/RseB C-terminal domain-containing protein [Halioglobus sp.]|nr:MucB/RseB C-terminal domain-containing protein [Halioglobus sp.]
MRRRYLAKLAAIAALGALPVGIASAEVSCDGGDARAFAWLDKMASSMHETSYHGVATLQRRDDMQVIQVSHMVAGGASSERLTQLTGQGARVDRHAHPLGCKHPGQMLLKAGSRLSGGDCGIADHYRFSIDGNERVAGRAAVRIRIRPLDVYRYGYQLALDRETGLLLKTVTYGHGDKVLEKFQYANLSLGDSLPGTADVEVVHRAQHPHPDSSSLDAPVRRAWSVRWLPRGFTATDSPQAVSGRRSYTDGLAVFSVFMEELERGLRPGEGVVRDGGTTSYTRGMSLDGQPVLVTVIGEVPVNTARMVADSVNWEQ